MLEDFDLETSDWLEQNDLNLDACESLKPETAPPSTRKRVSVAREQFQRSMHQPRCMPSHRKAISATLGH